MAIKEIRMDLRTVLLRIHAEKRNHFNHNLSFTRSHKYYPLLFEMGGGGEFDERK